MVFGVICSCCGEKLEVETATSGDALFQCQPCTDEPKAALPDLSIHTIPTDSPVVVLEADAAFKGLTDKEQARSNSTPSDTNHHFSVSSSHVLFFCVFRLTLQHYAYFLSKADWEGAKICLLQTSPECTLASSPTLAHRSSDTLQLAGQLHPTLVPGVIPALLVPPS